MCEEKMILKTEKKTRKVKCSKGSLCKWVGRKRRRIPAGVEATVHRWTQHRSVELATLCLPTLGSLSSSSAHKHKKCFVERILLSVFGFQRQQRAAWRRVAPLRRLLGQHYCPRATQSSVIFLSFRVYSRAHSFPDEYAAKHSS